MGWCCGCGGVLGRSAGFSQRVVFGYGHGDGWCGGFEVSGLGYVCTVSWRCCSLEIGLYVGLHILCNRCVFASSL